MRYTQICNISPGGVSLDRTDARCLSMRYIAGSGSKLISRGRPRKQWINTTTADCREGSGYFSVQYHRNQHIRRPYSIHQRYQNVEKTTYPGRHCYHGIALGTKIQMQDNDGNDNSEDAETDDEYEIHHYRHILRYLYYILFYTVFHVMSYHVISYDMILYCIIWYDMI